MTKPAERTVSGYGVLIRRLREEKNLSQNRLAKIAGCDGQTISNLETGRTSYLRGEQLEGVARALGLTPEEFEREARKSQTDETDMLAAAHGTTREVVIQAAIDLLLSLPPSEQAKFIAPRAGRRRERISWDALVKPLKKRKH